MFICICLCVSALSVEEEEDRWVLETGRQYYLTVRIHDSKGHVVHLSQVVLHSFCTVCSTASLDRSITSEL